jgi:hypothetical protein
LNLHIKNASVIDGPKYGQTLPLELF